MVVLDISNQMASSWSSTRWPRLTQEQENYVLEVARSRNQTETWVNIDANALAKKYHERQLAEQKRQANTKDETNLWMEWINSNDDDVQNSYLSGSRTMVLYNAMVDWAWNNEWLDLTNKNPQEVFDLYQQNNWWEDIMLKYLNWEIDEWAMKEWLRLDTWNPYEEIWNFWWDYYEQLVKDNDMMDNKVYLPWNNEKEKTSFWNKMWNAYKDMSQATLDLASWPYKLLNKWVTRAIWAWLNAIGADEAETDEWLAKRMEEIDESWNIFWADRDSLTYAITNILWDLWLTALISSMATEWKWVTNALEIRMSQLLSKYPKFLETLKNSPKAVQFINNLIWKWAVWGIEWMSDIAIYNTLQWEGTTPSELAEWAAFWAAFNEWTTAAEALIKRYWYSWVLTPARAEWIINTMKQWWDDVTWLWWMEDIATAMSSRLWTWTKRQIIRKAKNSAEDAKTILDTILSKSTSTHDVEYADEALRLLLDKLKDKKLSKDLKAVNELLTKKGKYTLSDLEETKRLLDKRIRMYDSKWEWLSWEEAMYFRELRAWIKKKIEEVADAENLADVRKLNYEIALWESVAQWVQAKNIAEQVEDWTKQAFVTWWVWMSLWTAYWYMQRWQRWDAMKYWLLWFIANNTAVKTHLVSLVNRMWSKKSQSLAKWIQEKWLEYLEDDDIKLLTQVIKDNPTFADEVKNIVAEAIRAWSIIWMKEWYDAIKK